MVLVGDGKHGGQARVATQQHKFTPQHRIFERGKRIFRERVVKTGLHFGQMTTLLEFEFGCILHTMQVIQQGTERLR